MKLLSSFYPEPNLEFGTGEADTPKGGLEAFGPYTIRLGPTHPTRVKVGLVGTADSIAAARRFLRSCLGPLSSRSTNLSLAPNYPGFSSVFRLGAFAGSTMGC